jgi:hypothetical protein
MGTNESEWKTRKKRIGPKLDAAGWRLPRGSSSADAFRSAEGVTSPPEWVGRYNELNAAAERMQELAPDPISQRKCHALARMIHNTYASWGNAIRTGWFDTHGGKFNWTDAP